MRNIIYKLMITKGKRHADTSNVCDLKKDRETERRERFSLKIRGRKRWRSRLERMDFRWMAAAE